eukprot:655699-Rhodomonas_salina.1
MANTPHQDTLWQYRKARSNLIAGSGRSRTFQTWPTHSGVAAYAMPLPHTPDMALPDIAQQPRSRVG